VRATLELLVHAAREILSKNLVRSEKSTFLPVLGRFCMRALWRRLSGKCQSFVRNLNFWPARHAPRQFSPIAHNPDHLLCAFWTAGFTPRPPDVGSVWCILIFQVSNRTIGCILDRSARLYGDCMEPDHTAKYSLPVLTDSTENIIPQKNICVDPLTVLRVFLDASRHSAFTHVVFVSKTQILTKL
jgi:hypothetical protein